MDTKLKPGDTASVIAAKTREEWEQRAFSGDAPFTDGVTPEMEQAKAKEEADAAALRQKRLQAKEYARLRREVFKEPEVLARIAKDLAKAEFSNPLTEAEQTKTRKLCYPRDTMGAEPKRGCNTALFRYMRAQFYAGGGINVLVMKPLRQAADVFRIADMARVLFWKYRKPGMFGTAFTDADLNYSTQRVQVDIECNPDIVALLEQFKEELFALDRFKENPLENFSELKVKRNEKRFRVATVMRRYDEVVTGQLEVLKRITDLEQRNVELANRLKAAPTLEDLSVIADRLNNTLTLEALRPTSENIKALAEIMQRTLERFDKLAESMQRTLERIDILERDHHSCDGIIGGIAANPQPSPEPGYIAPIVTC